MIYRDDLEWIPTADVRVGDQIAMLLSDGQAYPTVTGWTDKDCDLTRYNLGVTVYRTFTVDWCPWWGEDMRTFAFTSTRDSVCETLIVTRRAEQKVCPECDALHDTKPCTDGAHTCDCCTAIRESEGTS